LNEDLPESVVICDVTIRDGEQTPGVSFRLEDKITVVKKLDAMGVPQIQVGIAGSSKAAKEEAEAICNLGLSSKIEAMTRGTFDGWRGDVDAAVRSGADIVHSFIPTSRYFRGIIAHCRRKRR